MRTHLDQLIDRWRESELSEDELRHLADVLATREGRAALRNDWFLEAGLPQALSTLPVRKLAQNIGQMGPAQVPQFRNWLSWRSLTAAAAGLVIGVFGATAVWAFTVAKSLHVREVQVVDAGFENNAPIPIIGMPQEPGQWTGDPCVIVETDRLVHAREGHRMLKFLAASNTGDFEGSKNMASDLWQVIPIQGRKARTFKIRAWFNADTDKQARFHIAAVAGDDASVNAKDLWEQRYSDGGSLAFARSLTFVDRDPETWEAGELTLQVPPEARVLVIGIAAYRLPVAPPHEWFPAQFVDDVVVSVTEEALP